MEAYQEDWKIEMNGNETDEEMKVEALLHAHLKRHKQLKGLIKVSGYIQ